MDHHAHAGITWEVKYKVYLTNMLHHAEPIWTDMWRAQKQKKDIAKLTCQPKGTQERICSGSGELFLHFVLLLLVRQQVLGTCRNMYMLNWYILWTMLFRRKPLFKVQYIKDVRHKIYGLWQFRSGMENQCGGFSD